MTAAPIDVWLELDLDAQPIEGTLGRRDGPRRPFVGWLGLTAALEELRGSGADATDARAQEEAPGDRD